MAEQVLAGPRRPEAGPDSGLGQHQQFTAELSRHLLTKGYRQLARVICERGATSACCAWLVHRLDLGSWVGSWEPEPSRRALLKDPGSAALYVRPISRVCNHQQAACRRRQPHAAGAVLLSRKRFEAIVDKPAFERMPRHAYIDVDLMLTPTNFHHAVCMI